MVSSHTLKMMARASRKEILLVAMLGHVGVDQQE